MQAAQGGVAGVWSPMRAVGMAEADTMTIAAGVYTISSALGGGEGGMIAETKEVMADTARGGTTGANRGGVAGATGKHTEDIVRGGMIGMVKGGMTGMTNGGLGGSGPVAAAEAPLGCTLHSPATHPQLQGVRGGLRLLLQRRLLPLLLPSSQRSLPGMGGVQSSQGGEGGATAMPIEPTKFTTMATADVWGADGCLGLSRPRF